MNKGKYVLNSYAILALAEDEPGAQAVADIIMDEHSAAYLSIINLGEVYSIVLRRQGENTAAELVRGIRQEDRLVIAEAAWSRGQSCCWHQSRRRFGLRGGFWIRLGSGIRGMFSYRRPGTSGCGCPAGCGHFVDRQIIHLNQCLKNQLAPLKTAHLSAASSPKQAFSTIWIKRTNQGFRVCKDSGVGGRVWHRQEWEFDPLAAAEALLQNRLWQKLNPDRRSRRQYWVDRLSE